MDQKLILSLVELIFSKIFILATISLIAFFAHTIKIIILKIIEKQKRESIEVKRNTFQKDMLKERFDNDIKMMILKDIKKQ